MASATSSRDHSAAWCLSVHVFERSVLSIGLNSGKVEPPLGDQDWSVVDIAARRRHARRRAGRERRVVVERRSAELIAGVSRRECGWRRRGVLVRVRVVGEGRGKPVESC